MYTPFQVFLSGNPENCQKSRIGRTGLKKKSALRVGGFILYKYPKFSPPFARGCLILTNSQNLLPRFARGGFIFLQNLLPKCGQFLDCFPLITAQNPKKFRALRAQGFGDPQKISALRAGFFILYKILKKFLPRFARGVLFFTKSWNFFTGGFHVGGLILSPW